MSPHFRTFRAETTQAALAQVRAALGADAVILSTRNVAETASRSQIEMTAAAGNFPFAEPPASANRSTGAARAAYEERIAETAAAAPPPTAAPDPRFADELVLLRGTVEQVRKEMRLVAGQLRPVVERALPSLAGALHSQLVARGMEECLADEIMRQAVARTRGDEPASLLAAARDALGEKVLSGRAPWLRERASSLGSSRRIIALVGPTGVGKTTTLAKIAARALMESKLKVSLITVDTYRIGASEQVARYGEIMNVPTHVAKDRAELARAIERSRGADLVLIDTAGRSLSEAIARQAELIRTVPGVQLYLVASAATGAKELAAVAERYRPLSPERLVITKIDEAVGPASLVSVASRIGRPISAVADGQRVPEDLHALTSAQLSELVIGQWNENRADSMQPRRA